MRARLVEGFHAQKTGYGLALQLQFYSSKQNNCNGVITKIFTFSTHFVIYHASISAYSDCMRFGVAGREWEQDFHVRSCPGPSLELERAGEGVHPLFHADETDSFLDFVRVETDAVIDDGKTQGAFISLVAYLNHYNDFCRLCVLDHVRHALLDQTVGGNRECALDLAHIARRFEREGRRAGRRFLGLQHFLDCAFQPEHVEHFGSQAADDLARAGVQLGRHLDDRFSTLLDYRAFCGRR